MFVATANKSNRFQFCNVSFSFIKVDLSILMKKKNIQTLQKNNFLFSLGNILLVAANQRNFSFTL